MDFYIKIIFNTFPLKIDNMFLPKVITFSGLDGAGKSTVINTLKERLEADGFSVKIFPCSSVFTVHCALPE